MPKTALRVLFAATLATAVLAVVTPADATAERVTGTGAGARTATAVTASDGVRAATAATAVDGANAAEARAPKAQAPDTGPCGPAGPFRSWDWWRTTNSPAIAPAVRQSAVEESWQWRHDDNTLWRGDTRENVQQIFEEGFTPRGETLTPLDEYIVRGGGQTTAHLSTSCEKWVGQKFATYGPAKTGWVYEIEAPGGIDVNATALLNGYESPYLWNKEIDFPGGIDGRYIKGACKYRLVGTDPQTRVNTYDDLGCLSNHHFRGVHGVDGVGVPAAAAH